MYGSSGGKGTIILVSRLLTVCDRRGLHWQAGVALMDRNYVHSGKAGITLVGIEYICRQDLHSLKRTAFCIVTFAGIFGLHLLIEITFINRDNICRQG